MKLKVVCQVCGKVEELDINKPTEWKWIELNEEILKPIDKIFKGYEVWICPECVATIEEEDPLTYMEKMEKLVKESLYGEDNET